MLERGVSGIGDKEEEMEEGIVQFNEEEKLGLRGDLDG